MPRLFRFEVAQEKAEVWNWLLCTDLELPAIWKIMERFHLLSLRYAEEQHLWPIPGLALAAFVRGRQ